MYDLAIIGGGPAGVAAGIYAARKKIKTILITDIFGGQSLVSDQIQNWIGTKNITGLDLTKNLEEHLRAQEGIDIKAGVLVLDIKKGPSLFEDGLPDKRGAQFVKSEGFTLGLKNGEEIKAKYILITAGSRRKKLEVPGEKEFEGRGVVYCATCDAPIFRGKTVAVVGGGNSGLESVIDLLPYATKIYLLSRYGELKGDKITQEKIKKSDKVEVIYNAAVQEIVGKDFVTGLKYKTGDNNHELELGGVFVEIGSTPNSGLLKDLVKLNERGEVIVDHKTQKAGEGIWAAGDVTDVLYKQNNISVGDAIKAALNIYDSIHEMERAASVPGNNYKS